MDHISDKNIIEMLPLEPEQGLWVLQKKAIP